MPELPEVETVRRGLAPAMEGARIESVEQRMRHLDLLRTLQRETGGFTEFVPLSFVHAEAPLFLERDVQGVVPGPSGDDGLITLTDESPVCSSTWPIK